MKVSDKIISVIILGLIAPVILTLALWWGSIPLSGGNNRLIMILAISGLIAGLIIDFTVLRKFIFRLFDLSVTALISIEVLYSVLIYGLFMGFPVINSITGIAATYILLRSCKINNLPKDLTAKRARIINLASFAILFLLCVCTAVMALNENTICNMIKSMLNLHFDVTMGMVWALIIAGGVFLLGLQYLFSKLLFHLMIKNKTSAV